MSTLEELDRQAAEAWNDPIFDKYDDDYFVQREAYIASKAWTDPESGPLAVSPDYYEKMMQAAVEAETYTQTAEETEEVHDLLLRDVPGYIRQIIASIMKQENLTSLTDAVTFMAERHA